MPMAPPRPVIVMPVFEDRASARFLLRDIAATEGIGRPFVVVVEDGSLRDPMTAADIAEAGLDGEVLHLARNMGHQRAIATGLAHVAQAHPGGPVVVMDADGEDEPAAIPALLAALSGNGADAVVAERRRRSEAMAFRAFYVLYRFFFQLVTGRAIRFGNFSAISAATVQRLVLMPELWLHLASSLIVSRMRIASVPTDRGRRYAGTSRMNFVSLSLHGMRSMMVFAEDVVVRVGVMCAALATSSGLLLTASAILKIIGIATPGWYSTASGILVVIMLQAGILAFLMLMVTGATRSGPPVLRAPLELLVARVERTPG
jgi:hypothetical protein